MALATAMYHSGRNPLRKVRRDAEAMPVAKGLRQRRLHKAFLRYHDAENWPMLRKALKRMGRADLIGNGKRHLVPAWQPKGTGTGKVQTTRGKPFLTQHTGLPPRSTSAQGSSKAGRRARRSR
jgi:hypothetical protein